MKIRDVMTPFSELSCVTSSDTLVSAAKKMKEADTGVIPVVQASNKKHLVGIITDRDIAVRAVADSVDLTSAKVSDFMTKGVTWCSPDASIREAADMMGKHQVQRLPVEENGELAGMISLGDIAEVERRNAGKALEGIKEGARSENRVQ